MTMTRRKMRKRTRRRSWVRTTTTTTTKTMQRTQLTTLSFANMRRFDQGARSNVRSLTCWATQVNRTKNKWKAALKFGVMTLAINDSGRVRKQVQPPIRVVSSLSRVLMDGLAGFCVQEGKR
eukprot:767946-Hanusia_phi.AAC.6